MAIDKKNNNAINKLNELMNTNNVKILLILLNMENKSEFAKETILNICKFPKLQYIKDQYEKHNIEECGICFDNNIIIKAKCLHSLCYKCFDKLYDDLCPFCRKTIQ